MYRELTNDLIGASALIEFMAVEEPEETVRGAVKVALISAVLKCSMQKEVRKYATLMHGYLNTIAYKHSNYAEFHCICKPRKTNCNLKALNYKMPTFRIWI